MEEREDVGVRKTWVGGRTWEGEGRGRGEGHRRGKELGWEVGLGEVEKGKDNGEKGVEGTEQAHLRYRNAAITSMVNS